MINFIIALTLVHFIKAIIIKKRSTVLGCGLLGFSGEYAADKDKIAILFMYNQTRGEDSCGYYNHVVDIDPGDRVHKYSGKVSLNLLPKHLKEPSNLFIGHTRAATSGTGRTFATNAHPFLFGKWIGAHNGTLTNTKGLLREYDMDEKTIDIDSKIFPASIAQNENFKVLNHYEGAAALLWANTDIKKNNTLYAYHDKERPLFYGTIKKNKKIGMYMSSIEASLFAIGCEDVKAFDVDTLHSIKKGLITEKMTISRTNPIKNEEKRLPESVLLPCRARRTMYTQKGKTTTVFTDDTIIVTIDSYLGQKKCLKEEVLYDPAREITVHVRYMSDGGFEEVLVSDYRDNLQEESSYALASKTNYTEQGTIAVEDVMDYMSELYSKLDEARVELSIALEDKGVKEEDIEGLDNAMVNVTKFIGSLAEIGELEED